MSAQFGMNQNFPFTVVPQGAPPAMPAMPQPGAVPLQGQTFPGFQPIQAIPTQSFGVPQPANPQQFQFPDGIKDVNQLVTEFQKLQDQSRASHTNQPQQVDYGQLLQQQNQEWNNRFERLLQTMSQNNGGQSGPDYLSMSPDKLVEALNDNGPEVLKAIQQQAVSLAEQQIRTPLQKELQDVKEMLNFMTQQQIDLKADSQIQHLKKQYGNDPEFQKHMEQAAQFLGTPIGKAMADQNPDQAIEMAYKIQLADRIFDPTFQQQLGQAFTQNQNQLDLQRYQAALPPASFQNPAPMQKFGPMGEQAPQQNAQQADMNVMAQILRHSNVLGIPNVRVVSPDGQQRIA